MSQNHQICFYETDKAYGCFSNFSKHPIELDGVSWPTTEHYFQGQKFTNQADVDAVLNAPTPFIAAQIGRERERSLRQDWEDFRNDVMLRALVAKFTQHADLSEILLSTRVLDWSSIPAMIATGATAMTGPVATRSDISWKRSELIWALAPACGVRRHGFKHPTSSPQICTGGWVKGKTS